MNILLINCSPVRNGATAEIVKTVHSFLDSAHKIHSICIDDYDIHYCKGCRSCHQTSRYFKLPPQALKTLSLMFLGKGE